MKPRFNIAVLISGRGSNLKSLIDQAHHYQITRVISNNPDAAGLDFARCAGIETSAFARSEAASLLDHKAQIYAQTETSGADLIVLAGFMQILEKDFVAQHRGKIVNIHPSLLPDFKGLETHKKALDAYHLSKGAAPAHGCTVHYVEYAVDSGPLIAQATCKIAEKDTIDSLAARVLEQEHRLFPWVINSIANGEIQYLEGKVAVKAQAKMDGKRLGFQFVDSDASGTA